MARKKRHEEHVNHERWLVSYADFITLLFAFFVVMYSVSSVNQGKYRVLSDSLTSAFRQQPHSILPVQVGEESPAHVQGEFMIPGSQSLIALPIQVQGQEQKSSAARDQEAVKQEQDKPKDDKDKALEEPTFADPEVAEIADKITAAMSGLIKDDLITVRRDARWLEVEIKSSILYPSGSAQLTPNAYPMLEELASILAPFQNPIHVEGFTDNIPIHTLAFLSNWELSAARAASVVHVFMQKGVAPQRMAAIGYGEFKPVGDNDTVEGRAKNRRVILVIMPGEDPRWARAPNELPDTMDAAELTPAPIDSAPAPALNDPFINPAAPPAQNIGTGSAAP